MRLAVVASHPIQYYVPVFRELAQRLDLKVFFAHRATPDDQAKAGFGVGFDWDVDLHSGYEHVFLRNVAKKPGLDHYSGCDTPEIWMQLAKGQFDAVLVQGWHRKSYLQTILAAKRQGLPLLVRGDSHIETPRSNLKRSAKAVVYPAFLRLFDAALYVGKRSKEYWTHYYYPSKRLFFSPHCVDTEWFRARATDEGRNMLRKRLGIDPGTTVILFAGKLVPFKRPLDIVGAAEQLKAVGKRIAILVAGAGPLESEMIDAARASGVAFHALGFCNQSAMPAVYAASDILVLPSDGRETWGLVANEALACGRPIVLANTVGAAPDLAMDKSVGRVFPVGDIATLASAISELAECPPSSKLIATKSDAYSLEAAATGIVRAVMFAAKAKELQEE